jgi:hypothetical protein
MTDTLKRREEVLAERSKIFSYLETEFVPLWYKKGRIELGTRFEGNNQIKIIVGVQEAFIGECRALLDERFKNSIVPVVVERETLPYVKNADYELKPWWKCW